MLRHQNSPRLVRRGLVIHCETGSGCLERNIVIHIVKARRSAWGRRWHGRRCWTGRWRLAGCGRWGHGGCRGAALVVASGCTAATLVAVAAVAIAVVITTALAATDGGAAVSAETVRRRIKTLIEGEAAEADVLSDDRIVDILKEAGVDIARRTVAKYREAMRIPSSVERKRLLKHAG